MRRIVAVALAAVVLVFAGGIAWASIPDANGVIHGCRKNTDGSLRVIDTDLGQTCANGWTPLNWSQTGPPGPAGPAGVSGYDDSVSTALSVPGIYAERAFYCNDTKVPIDFGYEGPVAANWTVTLVRTTVGPNGERGMFFRVYNNTGEPITVIGYLICVVNGS